MISPNDIQAGLVSRLKANSGITSLLASSDEVREDEWQGTEFEYPNIRVRLDPVVPIANCSGSEITGGILCYSESPSSKEANTIAKAVVDDLHGKGFESGGVRFSAYCRSMIPAIREDERTWRSEILFSAIVE